MTFIPTSRMSETPFNGPGKLSLIIYTWNGEKRMSALHMRATDTQEWFIYPFGTGPNTTLKIKETLPSLSQEVYYFPIGTRTMQYDMLHAAANMVRQSPQDKSSWSVWDWIQEVLVTLPEEEVHGILVVAFCTMFAFPLAARYRALLQRLQAAAAAAAPATAAAAAEPT